MASQPQPPSTVPSALRVVATNEKVTGPAGVEMLRRSGIATSTSSDGLIVLDNACGGGVLTSDLLNLAQEDSHMKRHLKKVKAADIDDRMVAYTADRKASNNWNDSLVEVIKQDQQTLSSLSDDTYTHVFNNFGIFFGNDPDATLAQTLRVLQPGGGVAGFTTWKGIKWWPTLAEPALAQYLPEAPKLPSPGTLFRDNGWDDASRISQRLEKAGFVDVEVAEYAFTPDVEAGEFAEACAVLAKVVAKKVWSEEEMERFGDKVEPAFLEYLRKNYPNGKWNDQMTALISLGKKM